MTKDKDVLSQRVRAYSYLIFALCLVAAIILASLGKLNFGYKDIQIHGEKVYESQKEELKEVKDNHEEEILNLQKLIYNSSVPSDIKDSILVLINNRKSDVEAAKLLLSKFELVESDEDKRTLLIEVLNFLSKKANREKFNNYVDIAEKMINKRMLKTTSEALQESKQELAILNSKLRQVLLSRDLDKKTIADLMAAIKNRDSKVDSLQQRINEFVYKINELEGNVSTLEIDKQRLRDTIGMQIPFRIEKCTFTASNCKSRKDGAYIKRCVDTIFLRFKIFPENGIVSQTQPLIISLTHPTPNRGPQRFQRNIIAKTGQINTVYFIERDFELIPGLYTSNIIYNHNGQNVSLNILELYIKRRFDK